RADDRNAANNAWVQHPFRGDILERRIDRKRGVNRRIGRKASIAEERGAWRVVAEVRVVVGEHPSERVVKQSFRLLSAGGGRNGDPTPLDDPPRKLETLVGAGGRDAGNEVANAGLPDRAGD